MVKNARFVFLMIYVIVVVFIFIFFKNNMNINMQHALLYSFIVVAAIVATDFLFNRVKSVVFFSCIAFGVLFLFIGDILSRSLISSIFFNDALRIGFLMFCVYAGVIIGIKNAWLLKSLEQFVSYKDSHHIEAVPKVLDTSTLIDGRIADLVESSLLEGSLVIPSFILIELQHVADSHEHLRRQKGKRGLETLKRLQDQTILPVEIQQVPERNDVPVDSRLISLAAKLGGAVITTDHNLAMVADIQKVKTININDFAMAMRQTLLPGEELTVSITKEGKEHNQGLAYLDDGTMVVVDAGKKHIGETVKVLITSLLQTDTGRIIFASIKD